MLSCRYSGPNSAPYNRRLESAIIILDIIFHGGYENLPPLPLIPYAMSMSTTMLYRALRDGQRDIITGTKDLRQCCAALDALGRRWTSVNGVAKLAKQLLRVLDQSKFQLGQSGNISALQESSSRSDEGTVTGNHGSFGITVEHRKSECSTNVNPIVTAISDQIQTNRSLHKEQASVDNTNFQKQQTEYGPGTYASYFEIDRAFHELFDCGMPNVFGGTPTSEYLHIPNDEEGCANSDFQVPSYFASRGLEFGYEYHQVNDSQELGG